MTIHIEQLTFKTIIGILTVERVHDQKVIVNLELNYDYNGSNFINYAEVINLIENDMREKQYELLESAITELIQEITSSYTQIKSLTLKITKPDIIKNAQVSLSSNWFKA